MESGVRHFVFSSTAAVYGTPAEGVAAETTPTAPINPYGTSKLMSEWMLRDVRRRPILLSYVALRYFNVAGSDSRGRVGQATPKATLLVKVACEAAVGKRPHVSIFGTDYPTPDGTGVRDYIHVEDLATAHLDALDYLRARRHLHGSQCRLRPRLQRPPGTESVERVTGQRLKVARNRAEQAIRPPWWRAPTASATSSAGGRASTTSTPSSRTSPGSSGNRRPLLA